MKVSSRVGFWGNFTIIMIRNGLSDNKYDLSVCLAIGVVVIVFSFRHQVFVRFEPMLILNTNNCAS